MMLTVMVKQIIKYLSFSYKYKKTDVNNIYFYIQFLFYITTVHNVQLNFSSLNLYDLHATLMSIIDPIGSNLILYYENFVINKKFYYKCFPSKCLYKLLIKYVFSPSTFLQIYFRTFI